jgi:hypothetical protein
MSDVGADPERYFGRPLVEVSPGDLWRWLAAKKAMEQIREEGTPPRSDE